MQGFPVIGFFIDESCETLYFSVREQLKMGVNILEDRDREGFLSAGWLALCRCGNPVRLQGTSLQKKPVGWTDMKMVFFQRLIVIYTGFFLWIFLQLVCMGVSTRITWHLLKVLKDPQMGLVDWRRKILWDTQVIDIFHKHLECFDSVRNSISMSLIGYDTTSFTNDQSFSRWNLEKSPFESILKANSCNSFVVFFPFFKGGQPKQQTKNQQTTKNGGKHFPQGNSWEQIWSWKNVPTGDLEVRSLARCTARGGGFPETRNRRTWGFHRIGVLHKQLVG